MVDFHELGRTIDRALPGEGVWLQSATDEEGAEAAAGMPPATEGLAIRRESGPKGSWWLVLFFRVVQSSVVEARGGGREGPEMLRVDVGYTNDHDTLGEAKVEARGLLKHLPRMGFSDEDRTQDFIFAALDDLEA